MPNISQAVIDRAVQDIQRTQEQAEKQLREDQAVKVGRDPSQPYHPTLNASQDDCDRWWWEDRKRKMQWKYRKVWDDCIEKIKAKTWTTRVQIARHYQRSNSWATCMVQLMQHHQVFTAEELRALLPGNLKKKTRRERSKRT